VGSVSDNLSLFHGVWHDVISAHRPDGSEFAFDEFGGTPGPVPYEQLVYLDFDGARLTQTNVVLRGRDPHARTFGGSVVDGVLVFDALGPQAPTMLGVSGGPGVLVFLPERVDDDAVGRFHDPDYIRHLGGDQRTRTTTLYRDGELKRVLTVRGTRVSTDPGVRLPWDPRGASGPVHDGTIVTRVYTAPYTDEAPSEETP
jgi:hypothetical protein